VRDGLSLHAAARAAGVGQGTAVRWFGKAGGMSPIELDEPSSRYLSLAEREEIACLAAAGHGPREIGRRIGRPASTVSREVARNTTSPQRGYRAWTAQARAEANAARPKQRKLATQLSLRAQVQ
jgi:transposase